MFRTLPAAVAGALAVSLLGSSAAAPHSSVSSPPAVAGSASAAAVVDAASLSLEGAKVVAAAAAASAVADGAGGAIAVVDPGGHLILLERLDGTFPAAAEVACRKARTAAIFRKPTQDFENAIRAGRHSLIAVDAMTPLEGGVPIVAGGRIVGAIGVSGGKSSAHDVEIAQAGAAAIK